MRQTRFALATLALLAPATALAQGAPQPAAPPPPAPVTPPAAAPAPADETGKPGFTLVVQGNMPDMAPEAFAGHVLQALPEALTDPARNFSRSTGYDPKADYRLVMLFHGDDAVEMNDLCRVVAKQQATPNQPPQFLDLKTTVRVAGAFCRGEETLSTARNQATGEVKPDQASFRFLVTDLAKQLFPGGFDTIPGQEATATTTGAGTR